MESTLEEGIQNCMNVVDPPWGGATSWPQRGEIKYR